MPTEDVTGIVNRKLRKCLMVALVAVVLGLLCFGAGVYYGAQEQEQAERTQGQAERGLEEARKALEQAKRELGEARKAYEKSTRQFASPSQPPWLEELAREAAREAVRQAMRKG